MSHPSLGLPPNDPSAGPPGVAARIRGNRDRLAARALRVAMDGDPSIERRYDEVGLRRLLHDAGLLTDRVALCVETARPELAGEYAEWTASTYRRLQTPMDDLVALCEGLRSALPNVLAPGELAAPGDAIDAAIAAYRWHRRIAGDARRKNAFLQFLYKGG